MSRLAERRDLLERLLPGEPVDRLLVECGQFHDVVIGAERVVCFARTDAAAARLPGRAAVLRALAELDLGFRTPEPLLQSEPGEPGEPAFLVLSRIPGTTLPRQQVSPQVAAQYAGLLAGLAEAGADERVRATLPAVPVDLWTSFAAEVRAELFGLMSAAGRRRAEAELAAASALPHRTDVVMHGDLGGENVLWESAGAEPRLSGVIDWDNVALGDPAVDLAAIGASYGQGLLTQVLERLRRREPDLTDRIRAIRGTFALQQAIQAHHDGDAEQLADGLAGYH